MQSLSNLPKVSIVIPVYNGSNYLAEAIDSALTQTYPNVEVIVVDDGSSDGGLTEGICRGYGQKIRYFHKQNGGVSSALNFGIENMEGEYFSWLSHDDIYYPDKVERQVEYLKSNPLVRIVGTGLDVIDDAGNEIGDHIPKSETIVLNGRDVMDTWIYGCSLLIDRKVFDEVGGFNLENRTVQDLEMWLDIAKHGISFHFLSDALCQWRKHAESGSFAGRRAHFDEVELFFASLITKYSLSFFMKKEGQGSSQDVYEWLGDQARHRGAVKKARDFYLAAWIRNPNLFRTMSRRRLWKFVSHLLPRDASLTM